MKVASFKQHTNQKLTESISESYSLDESENVSHKGQISFN